MQELLVSRRRRIAGNVLVSLCSVILTLSAAAKLARIPKVVSELGGMGFSDGRLIFIAVLELVCAVLFFTPYLRSLGLLLVSAYMGGAIATHLQHGQSMAQPGIILALIWIGTWVRDPQILWSLRPGGPADL